MSLRSPLGKVLGTGSAKEGPARWRAERLTAMALVPLTLWFFFSLLLLPSLDFAAMRAWMAVPLSAFLSIVLVAVLAYHAYLGLNVVVEDYVHAHGPKLLLTLGLKFLYVVCGGAGIFAILRISLGS